MRRRKRVVGRKKRVRWKGFVLLSLFVILLGGGTDIAEAQGLPSWAEPNAGSRDVEPRVDRFPSEDKVKPTRSPRAPGGFDRNRSEMNVPNSGSSIGETGIGGPISRGSTGGGPCNVSEDCPGYPNAYCAPNKGKEGKCYSNQSGPGNGSGGGQKPPDVPITGWLWLAAAGLGYGGYRLR